MHGDRQGGHAHLAAGICHNSTPLLRLAVVLSNAVTHAGGCAPLNAFRSCHVDKASGADVCMPGHATSTCLLATAHDWQCELADMHDAPDMMHRHILYGA